MPSRRPEQAGLQPALFGTLWVISLTALIAFPVGVGAAIYLEEYAPKNWWTRLLQTNISNLAGVPSVVYGLLGLGLFVNLLALGRSILAGALTMALLILPVIIIASQEAIRAVPPSLRQAAFALGATSWQVTRAPRAAGGDARHPDRHDPRDLARDRRDGAAAGGWRCRVRHLQPDGLLRAFTVLPMQIYDWAPRPQEEFQDLAAGGDHRAAGRACC